jgi:hypothetical protein
LFFERPEPTAIVRAATGLASADFDPATIAADAERYSKARFAARIREIAKEELALADQ